eukprot:scaffold2214_cov139-Cylindrotheca_fusiformis.AAC.11
MLYKTTLSPVPYSTISYSISLYCHSTKLEHGQHMTSLSAYSPTMSSHSTRSVISVDISTPNKPSLMAEELPTAGAVVSSNSPNDDIWRLEFADFTDVQTRLILMPRIEEEGKGAVISNYTAARKEDNKAAVNEHRDDYESLEDMAGCLLIGMEPRPPGEENWKDMDFTTILANIRQEQSSPIILLFQSPQKEHKDNQADVHHNKVEATTGEKDSLHSLFSWGQRMRAQASVAANTAASAVATAAKERMQAKQQQQRAAPMEEKPCDVFLQTSVGAYIPVSSLKDSKVTTSSLLLVRKSATEALIANKNNSFQWYRSSTSLKVAPNDTASTTSSVNSSTMSQHSSNSNSTSLEGEWVPLDGATRACLQPNATLVGRRLRCIVRLAPARDVASCSSEDSDMDDDLNSVGSAQDEVIIDLKHPVVADLSLFNGARQALLRGAKFGVFKGRGSAQNHSFSIEVAIGVGKQHHKQVPMSAVTIHMTSAEETIKLTDQPVKQLSATADASDSKNLDLVFPMFLPDDGSMLSAMLTDGKLLLEASNRMTRESFLMALGIANYQGRPGNLGSKTILYQDAVRMASSSLMDDVSYSSESSVSQLQSPDKSTASSMAQLLSPVPPIPQSISEEGTYEDDEDGVCSLKKEVEFLRAKLARKDKVLSEMQRQVAKSEDVYQQTKQALGSCQKELKQAKLENQQMVHSSKSTEQTIHAQEATMVCVKKEHSMQLAFMETKLSKQADKIAELEKANRALQNEKAVLSAAVEARDSKLEKMGDLQSSFDEMVEQVSKYDALHTELDESNKRFSDAQKELESMKAKEKQCHCDLNEALDKVKSLTIQVQQKEEKAASCLAQLEPLQKKNQQLKAERNSFKQKNDSLSKEISKICRNGRSIHDVERMLADQQTLVEEVELLRKQKRKAMEDVHSYRTSYEQSQLAHEKAGLDNETRTALERNAELERLLAELTEYVNAKEMQLETMKQVNEHLQQEIHSLAQANLSKNEV